MSKEDLVEKRYQLSDILNALYKGPCQNEHHFLFFQGTDTMFIPRSTKLLSTPGRDYENVETLSYAAQFLSLVLDETSVHFISNTL